jgi:hypothetical protein
MTPLTCAATRRRLHAFHDHELSVSDQIAVASHLEWCDDCAAELADLRLLQTALRATAPGRQALSREEESGLQAAIAGRMRAERDQSFTVRVRDVFQDMHLVYAGLGGAAAAIACIFITLGLTRLTPVDRPASLAAFVNLLAAPGSNENPIVLDDRVLMPRALDGLSAPTGDATEEDAVFTLAAVVTREGRIANLELLHAMGDGGARLNDARLVERLLEKVSRARFEPARVGGLPVAVNVVWLVARTTVRASKRPIELSVPPHSKKGAASIARPTDARAGIA